MVKIKYVGERSPKEEQSVIVFDDNKGMSVEVKHGDDISPNMAKKLKDIADWEVGKEVK